MPTDDSALIVVVEGMMPPTTSGRASWPVVASAPVRGGGEFALPPALDTPHRCLLATVLEEEGEEIGPRTVRGRNRAQD